MNLTTARSAGRAREVGLRKVVGASRGQLIRQFFVESNFMSLLSLLLAVGWVHLFLPAFSQFIRRELTLQVSDDLFLWGGFLGTTLFVGILTGSYPALTLSVFHPIQVLSCGQLNQCL